MSEKDNDDRFPTLNENDTWEIAIQKRARDGRVFGYKVEDYSRQVPPE